MSWDFITGMDNSTNLVGRGMVASGGIAPGVWQVASQYPQIFNPFRDLFM